jgi:hypothetical protein
MRPAWIGCAALGAGLAWGAVAFADRASEDRDKATHVVVGRVEGVYGEEAAAGANRHYVVEIAVEKVERGDGLKVGDVFYASCYRPNPKAPDQSKMSERELKAYLFTVDGGHNAVPTRGDRVRVFVRHSRGKYNGVFPDWVDVLKDK